MRKQWKLTGFRHLPLKVFQCELILLHCDEIFTIDTTRFEFVYWPDGEGQISPGCSRNSIAGSAWADGLQRRIMGVCCRPGAPTGRPCLLGSHPRRSPKISFFLVAHAIAANRLDWCLMIRSSCRLNEPRLWHFKRTASPSIRKDAGLPKAGENLRTVFDQSASLTDFEWIKRIASATPKELAPSNFVNIITHTPITQL